MAEVIDPKEINYYLILGLDYDDKGISQSDISAAIQSKRLDWSKRSRGAESTGLYLKYLELIPDIEKVMQDETLRKKHAEAAKEIFGPRLQQSFLRIAKDKKINADILEKNARLIKKRFEETPGIRTKLPALDEFKVFVEKKATNAGFIIVAGETDSDSIYKKYYEEKPSGSDKFGATAKELQQLGHATLYDFLDKDPHSPLEVLKYESAEKKKNLPKSMAEHALAERICNACLDTFQNEDNRDKYDLYISWKERKNILDDLFSHAKVNGLTATDREDYQNKLAKLLGAKISDDLITSFCRVKGIPEPGSGKTENDNVKICRRCGMPNVFSKETKHCNHCGTTFKTPCPRCGKELILEVGIDVCSCGFKIKNIDAACALLDEAKEKIAVLNTSLAETLLKDAETYWPNSPEIGKLKSELTEAKQRFGNYFANLETAINSKRFFEAKRLYDELQSRIPGYENKKVSEQIETAIKASEELYQDAKTKQDFEELLEICSQAARVCSDNPKIKTLIDRYPPSSPTNLRITIDNVGKQNILTWNPAKSQGSVWYIVVRKKDYSPQNAADGELIERIGGCSFTDKTVEPGICYHYAVFSERAGVVSDPLYYLESPVNCLFDLSSFTAVPSDKAVRLTWPLPPASAKISLHRQNPDHTETHLSNISLTGYYDTGLVNDQTYHYRLSLVYQINGETHITEGIRCTVIPTSPPAPIDTLRIRPRSEGGVFEATWDYQENLEIQFYCSEKKPSFETGDVLSISELDAKMNRLSLDSIKNNTGIFRYTGTEGLFVTAVVLKSSNAVIGNICRVRANSEVKIHAVELVNGKITIWLDYPKDTTGFKVLWRFDTFAEDPFEKVPQKMYVGIKTLTSDGSNTISIENPESKDYYISVFAESKFGGNTEYSEGAQWLFKNSRKVKIFYSIIPKKKWLFGKQCPEITFESEENVPFTLPDIEVYSSRLRPPMFKSSGTLFVTIPKQKVQGSLTVPLPLQQNTPKELHLRPFLQNETLYAEYELILKSDSCTNIT